MSKVKSFAEFFGKDNLKNMSRAINPDFKDGKEMLEDFQGLMDRLDKITYDAKDPGQAILMDQLKVLQNQINGSRIVDPQHILDVMRIQTNTYELKKASSKSNNIVHRSVREYNAKKSPEYTIGNKIKRAFGAFNVKTSKESYLGGDVTYYIIKDLPAAEAQKLADAIQREVGNKTRTAEKFSRDDKSQIYLLNQIQKYHNVTIKPGFIEAINMYYDPQSKSTRQFDKGLVSAAKKAWYRDELNIESKAKTRDTKEASAEEIKETIDALKTQNKLTENKVAGAIDKSVKIYKAQKAPENTIGNKIRAIEGAIASKIYPTKQLSGDVGGFVAKLDNPQALVNGIQRDMKAKMETGEKFSRDDKAQLYLLQQIKEYHKDVHVDKDFVREANKHFELTSKIGKAVNDKDFKAAAKTFSKGLAGASEKAWYRNELAIPAKNKSGPAK